MTQSSFLRIGTRGSPLALAQAHEVRRLLAAAHGVSEDAIAVEIIKTTGDAILDRPLSEAGGKGLFTKEIEEALLAGTIDLAVHSSKDMPTVLPDGLELSAFLPREDVRDVLIAPQAKTLDALPKGAKVGTASLRRTALLLHERPDLQVVTFRGNVQTRLRKLAEGEVEATMLAFAGLRRLDMAHVATEIFAIERFLPAVGQGAIAIETAKRDERARGLVRALNHVATEQALAAERAFLHVLDGSCRTPISGFATVADGVAKFTGLVLRKDGSQRFMTQRQGNAAYAAEIGNIAARRSRPSCHPDFSGDPCGCWSPVQSQRVNARRSACSPWVLRPSWHL